MATTLARRVPAAFVRASRRERDARTETSAGRALRDALGEYATGVTVVTALDAGGGLCGLTANSFTSVSLEPPLVLVCIAHGSRTYASLRERGCFAVHILGREQEALARDFAARGGMRADRCRWLVNERGFPVLETCLTTLECRLFNEHAGGDHAIVVGEVERLSRAASGEPLLFHRGRLLGLAARE